MALPWNCMEGVAVTWTGLARGHGIALRSWTQVGEGRVAGGPGLAWSRTGSEMTTLATGYQGQEEVLPVSYFMGVLISHALCVGAASVY